MGGKRVRHEADVLMEVAGAVASEQSSLTLLHRLLDLVVELTRASRGAMISTGLDGHARDMVLLGPSGRRHRWEPASASAEVVSGLLGDTRSTRLQGLALPPRSLGFPAHQPPVTSLVGGQVRVLDRCCGCIYVADKRGDTGFTAEDERLIVALAAQVGLALFNLHLASEARLHAAWRDAVRRVASAIGAGATVRAFLAEVAGAVRGMADADLALVIGPDEDRGLPTVLAADGDGSARLLGLRRPPLPPLRGMGPAITARAGAAPPTSRTLWVMRTARRPRFDPAVSGLVESLWEQSAHLIDHVTPRSIGDGPASTQADQARGLHDDLVQTLFGIGMEIEAAALRVGEDDLASRLRGAASNLDWLIDRLRRHDEPAAASRAAALYERTFTPLS